MNKLMRTGLLGLAALLLASCSDDDEGVDCAQVVVFARSATGGCQSFPTPCDVPQGYVECCGGFLGGCVMGGEDVTCVDDPTDSCDPDAGGADCPGICQ
ncbi:hypothetical protein K8638_43000 [Myxococcus sp. RHST-1-4]|nr:hypothetical protein [Myxococcus sp. RHSTA-1-4]